jgi:iron complex outermembrane receptor protein
MPKGILLMAGAVCALTAGAGGAFAATADTTADTSANAATVTDIVVTAQKREENLEKVPVAISAYTSHTRDLVGIDTIQDLTKFTPGLE